MPNLITTAQVAERAGVSRRAVTRWVDAGRLTPTQQLPGLRGALLFDAETVDAFLAEETTTITRRVVKAKR